MKQSNEKPVEQREKERVRALAEATSRLTEKQAALVLGVALGITMQAD